MKYKLLLCGINLLLCLSTCFSSALMAAETVIDFTGKIKDGQNITAVIRKSIEEAPKADLKFVFPKGVFLRQNHLKRRIALRIMKMERRI